MKRLVLVLALVVVAGGAFFGAAHAGMMVEHWVTAEAAKAAAAYWTPERMLNAKPHPLPSLPGGPGEGTPLAKPADPPGVAPAGKPGGQDGSALLSDDKFEALAYAGALPGADEVAPMFDGYDLYPPPENTFLVPSYLYATSSMYFPYQALGKVYGTKYGGVNFQGSGSSIGGRAVLTAGHCVSDGAGHFHTNLVFIPKFYYSSGVFGTWSSFWATTFTAWHTSGNFSRDVGFFAVNDKIIGGVLKKLSATVGWLGFAYNWDRRQIWNMFGYPAATPYTGRYLYCTQASYAKVDASKEPDTTGIGTSQTAGCSGGPWILKFVPGASGANNYANGINSYVYTSQPKRIYSPYFDTSVNNMRLTAIAK